MAIGVPSTVQITPFSQEALQYKSKQNLPGSIPGVYYVQYAASTAVTNAGPLTLFNNTAATANGSLSFPAGFFNWQNGYNTTAPTVAAAAGTRLRITGLGTLLCSATPNLTLLAKFTNNAGTAQTLATTAVTALAAITNATTANTSPCVLTMDLVVSAYTSGAATGSITTSGVFKYNTTPLLGTAPLEINIPGGTPQTIVSSYDLSQPLTLDIQATISAVTASLTMTSWLIEVLN